MSLIEPLLLALLLPVVLTITPRTLPLLIVLPLLLLLRRRLYGRFFPNTPLNGTLILLILVILLNAWATVDFNRSLPHIASALYGIALYFAIVAFARRSSRPFHLALAAYMLLALAVAATALVATNWQAKLPLISAIIPRLPSVAGAINPNYLAGALLWLAPIPLILLLTFPTYARPLRAQNGALRAAALLLFLLATSLFLLAVLLLSQSRSGLLGLTAMLLFAVTVLLRRRPILRAALAISGLAIAILALSLLPTAFWVQLLGVSDVASLAEPATLGLDSRIEIWQRAIYLIQDFPLTGAGMNTFDPVVRRLYPLFIAGPDSPINHAHNHLLQAGVDLGIPGLIAYLAIWFGAAAMLRDVWRAASNPWYRALTLAFAAALLGHFIWGLAEAIPLGGRPGFIFWYLLALLAALPTSTK